MSAAAAPGHKKYYSAFTPLDIPGCQLWYDGADSSTIILSSGKVSQWKNKGVNGSQYDLIQSTAANQPTYTSNVGVVFSSASSTTLSSSSAPSTTIAINSYCVFTPNNNSRMRMFKFFGGSNIGSVLDTTVPTMFLASSAYYTTFSITASNKYITSQNVYSASSRGFSSNFSETTSLTTDAAASSLTLLFVGGEPTVYYDGILHEIITFDGYITAEQRQLIEGYLSRKWFRSGLSSTVVPFSPTSISGCQLWLDAADSNTLTTTPTSGTGTGTLSQYVTTSPQTVTTSATLSSLSSITGGTSIMNGGFIGSNQNATLAPSATVGDWYSYYFDGSYSRVVKIRFALSGSTLTVVGLSVGYKTTNSVTTSNSGATNDSNYATYTNTSLATSASASGYGVASFTINFPITVNGVTQWNDKSGIGNNATATTGPIQGTYNGYPVVNFNGTSQTMLSANTIPLTTHTLITVHRPAVINGNNQGNTSLFRYQGLGSTYIVFPFMNNTTPRGYITSADGSGTGSLDYLNSTLVENSVTTQLNIVIAAISSGSQKIYKNGTLQSSATQTLSGGTSESLIIGSYASSQYYQGGVAEMIVFNFSLSDTQRQQVEGYLAMKWGLQTSLPSTHPYAITGVPSTHPYYSITPVTRQFAPIDVPGCVLWLDATDQSSFTFSSGTNISQWRDKSSSGLTGTGVNSPTYSSNVLNGNPGVVFNGSSQYFDFGNVLNMGTSQIFVFVVSKFDASSGNAGIIGKTSARANTGRWALLRENGIMIWFVDIGAGGVTATFSDSNTNTRLLTSYWDRSNEYIFQNGTQIASNSVSSGSNFSNTDPLYVGAYVNSTGSGPLAGYYFPGKIGEIIVYLGSLTTGQRQQIEGYLAKKWGLLGSTSTIVPFSPTSISGCALWLDAADTTSLTLSGSNVTAWNDKSGTSRTVTLSGTSTYSNTTNTVSTTTSSFLYANVDSRKTTTTYFNVFIVYKWTGSGSGTDQSLWGNDVGGGWNRGQLLTFPLASSFAYGLTYAGTNPYTVAVSGLNNANKLLYTATYAYGITNSTGVYVNGSAASSFVTELAASSQSSTTNTYFGTINGSTYIAPLDINEILVYNVSLTATQRQQIEGYLAKKWGLQSSLPTTHLYATGLPSTHPYISRNPATPVFNPRQISNCALWLDAADYNSLTLSGSSVTQWRDKSGNGRNTSSVSGTPQLSYSGGFGSMPSIYFGANTAFTGPISYTGSTLTAFIVARANTSSSGLRFFSLGAAGRDDYGNTSDIVVMTTGNSATDLGWYRSYVNVGNGSALVSAIYNNPFLYTLNVNGSTGVIVVNGSTTSSGTTSGSFSHPTYAIGVGFFSGGMSAYLTNGFIAEIILYHASLTTAQRQQVEGYLTWKWGLNGGYMPTLTPFRPTSISGCQLWLDAADTSSLTLSGSNVTQWRDKSGNNLHASNTSNYPSFSNSNINFVTSNQLKLSPFIPAGSQNITLAIVWKTTSVSNASFQSIIENSPTFNTNYGGWWRFMTYQYGFGSRNADYYGLNEYGGNPTPLSNMPTFTANTMNLSFITQYSTNGTNFTINNYHNGSLYGTQSYTGAIVAGVQGTMGLNSNSESFNGSIAEVVIFLAQLTDTQRQQVEGYLATKWGLQGNLPSSHPYASRSIPSTHPYKLIKP